MKSPENTKKHVLCSSAFRSATCGRTTGISVYHTAGKCVYHTTGKYVCYLLLDIKPYVPEMNAAENMRIGWLTQYSDQINTRKADDRFK